MLSSGGLQTCFTETLTHMYYKTSFPAVMFEIVTQVEMFTGGLIFPWWLLAVFRKLFPWSCVCHY